MTKRSLVETCVAQLPNKPLPVKMQITVIPPNATKIRRNFKLCSTLSLLALAPIVAWTCSRQCLPIFIYELATDMHTLKFKTLGDRVFAKRNPWSDCVGGDFVVFIYAFCARLLSWHHAKRNFNTNFVFMLWCCKMSLLINLCAVVLRNCNPLHWLHCVYKTTRFRNLNFKLLIKLFGIFQDVIRFGATNIATFSILASLFTHKIRS